MRSVQNCKEKKLFPVMARKLAQAAALTALVMKPVQEMFQVVENRYDFVEIALLCPR